jgi:hypothetical protein
MFGLIAEVKMQYVPIAAVELVVHDFVVVVVRLLEIFE